MNELNFAYLDTETGGLESRLNPLLSIAVVYANSKFQNPIPPTDIRTPEQERTKHEPDGFSLKVLPPEKTVLEVPVVAHQFPPEAQRYKPRQRAYYWDVYNEKKVDDISDYKVITPGAVEVNGFIKPGPDGKWDMTSYHPWFAQAITLEVAERIYLDWCTKHFKKQPVLAIAHNADFDQKFVATYMPNLNARFWRRPVGMPATCFPYRKMESEDKKYYHDWYCTMYAFRLHIGQAKGSKLADLAMKCGHVNPAVHEALNDCRAGLAGMKWLMENGFGPRLALTAAP